MGEDQKLQVRQKETGCPVGQRYDAEFKICVEITDPASSEDSQSTPTTVTEENTTFQADLGVGRQSSTNIVITSTEATTVPTNGGVALETTASVMATPTTVATPQSADSNNSNNGGLAPGAVAGIAIGTLIIGAVAAFLAAMFIFKRRQKDRETNIGAGKGYTSYADSTPELVAMQQAKSVNVGGGRNSPYVQVSQSPIPPVIAAPALVHHQRNQSEPNTNFLPPAAHDSMIHSKVTALFNGLHQHVETHYRDVHASITSSMEGDLARFGAQGTNMAELLQDCSTPTTALKHALVVYVLSITSPSNRNEDTMELFPAELRSIRGSANGNAQLAAATTLHRRLSVYLYTSGTTSPARAVHSEIREAAEHFSLTFFPWANPGSSDQDKDEDLARLISEALDFSVWLYGQPNEYEFDWEGIGRRGVIVSPGLVRNHEDGKRDWIVEGVVVGM